MTLRHIPCPDMWTLLSTFHCCIHCRICTCSHYYPCRSYQHTLSSSYNYQYDKHSPCCNSNTCDGSFCTSTNPPHPHLAKNRGRWAKTSGHVGVCREVKNGKQTLRERQMTLNLQWTLPPPTQLCHHRRSWCCQDRRWQKYRMQRLRRLRCAKSSWCVLGSMNDSFWWICQNEFYEMDLLCSKPSEL